MHKNIRSLLTFLLGWPLSIVALFFLVKSFVSHLSQIHQSLRTVNIAFVLLALLCFAGYYLLRSFIWYTLLNYKNHSLDLRESLFQWSYAQIKRYIPGNIWGIVGVSVHFSRKKVPKSDLAASFLTESELVLLSSLFLALFSLPLLSRLVALPPFVQPLVVVLVLMGTILYFCSRLISRKMSFAHKITRYFLPQLPFTQIMSVWFLMTAAFFLYGLGTFLSATAIVYIDPNLLWEFIGYFVLSLLIGFLSFITPTGLGVREGIITLGLATLVPQSLAAFIALAARGVLIVAEILTLGVLYFAHKIRSGPLNQLSAWIRRHPHQTLLLLFYTAFVLYFSWISVLRYTNYYTGRFDLGNMEQTVWNSLHGHIFEFTNPNGTTIVSRLAFHADFFLALLVPVYALWQDPRNLLILQVMLTGAGVFFVYQLAEKITRHKNIALILSVLFLLNPSLDRSVIFDFHAVTIATTFLLGAFYFLSEKKYSWFGFFAVLAATTKEEIWAIVALFGIYMFFWHHKRVWGSAVFIVGAALFYYLIWHAIPQAAGSQHFALSYYSNTQSTDSPTSLIGSFVFSPLSTFNLLVDPARLMYLNALFMPLGYLSIFSPFFLIFAGPDLAVNLLSTKAELYQIYYQYTAAITPFIFISSIYGLSYIKKHFPKIPEIVFLIYLTVSGIFSAYLLGPLPGAKSPNLDMITKPMQDKTAVDKVLSAILPQYSVSTSNSLGSHVARRKFLFTMPYGWNDADYIIFYMNETNAYPSLADHKKQAEALLHDPRYVKYFDDGVVIAFRKKSITAPTGI